MTRPTDTVRVHPDPSGLFLDGIPAVAQDVPRADAAWMVSSGAFTREPPAETPTGPPTAVATMKPEGPADAGPSDSEA